MKRITLLSALLLAAVAAAAQKRDFVINTETPEGQLLQQIGLEEDPAQKALLLEQFAQQYPKHEAIGWVLAQLPPVYAKLGQPDKSLAACEKMLAQTPANAPGAHACLKTAEEQKDPDLVKKFAVLTHEAAKLTLAAPKPRFEFEDEEEAWKQSIDFAKQVSNYAEWSLYSAALQTPDPAKKIELLETLKSRNPESEYVDQLTPIAFLAYRQAGQTDQAVALAESAVAAKKANEDMLLVLADYHFTQKKDSAKTLEYSQMLIDYLEGRQPPEGVSAADWQKKKDVSLGMAYWMMGVTHSSQQKYRDADRELRKAITHIKDNPQLLAGALFHLGVANFQMGSASGNEQQILDAFKFTKQCADIKSPFQAQARKNLAAIQSQYRIR